MEVEGKHSYLSKKGQIMINGKFMLKSLIGKGSFGFIYKGYMMNDESGEKYPPIDILLPQISHTPSTKASLSKIPVMQKQSTGLGLMSPSKVVAIKLEKCGEREQLPIEVEVYKSLEGEVGFPKIYLAIKEGGCNVLVLDYLSKNSLETLVKI